MKKKSLVGWLYPGWLITKVPQNNEMYIDPIAIKKERGMIKVRITIEEISPEKGTNK